MTTALITGATSRLGFALAQRQAQYGHDLILVADSEEQLGKIKTKIHSIHQIRIELKILDLSRPEAVEQLYNETQEANRGIDILINCAGYGDEGYFSETEWHKELRMLRLNVFTMTRLTKLYLEHMMLHRKGMILNVSSILAYGIGPLRAVYQATKAYILHFSQNLQQELKETGVTVTTVLPGVDTSTKLHAIVGDEPDPEAARIAAVACKGMQSGKGLVICGWRAKLICRFSFLLPQALINRMVHAPKK